MTRIPPPLAEDATTATGNAGPCSLCQRAVLAGDRYALLVPSGKLAHLHCIAMAAQRRRAVPAIR
jgi:hypothetical protein